MNRKAYWIVAGIALILAAQAILSQFLRRDPILPSPPPLASLPLELGGWSQIREEVLDPKALEMLGPDDFVVRLYRGPGGVGDAELFVAYYKTQLRAKNAHDPKVCLPGAGWNPTESHLAYVNAGATSFPVNYYRIKRESDEQVVLYWFQTFKGVYTYEQQLQAHRVWDAVFENRTDMALVRITVPITAAGLQAADLSAMRLAGVVYRQLIPQFPVTKSTGT